MDEDTRSDVNANLMDPIFTVGAFGDSQRIKSFECFIIKLIYYSFMSKGYLCRPSVAYIT